MKMDTIIKYAIVIGVISLFFIEFLAIGGIDGSPSHNNQDVVNTEQISATTTISGIVDSYERVLFVETLTLEQQELVEGVEGVRQIDQQNGIYQISVLRKEDVIPIHLELLDLGIETFSTARITLDSSVTIINENGENTAFFANRKVKLDGIQPILEPESSVDIQTQVVLVGDQAFVNGPLTLSLSQIQTQGKGEVLGKKYQIEYIIPWEMRNIDLKPFIEEFGEENITFERSDNIIFGSTLSATEQVEKKKDYVEFITSQYATVDENFTDGSQILLDFGSNVILPNSTLTFNFNAPDLEFESTQKNTYDVVLEPIEGFFVRENLLQQELDLDFDLENGEMVDLEITAVTAGNNVVGIIELITQVNHNMSQ